MRASFFLFFFIYYFPNCAQSSMFASWMAQLGFFLPLYAATGNQTHVSLVALLLRDLNPPAALPTKLPRPKQQ